METTILPGCPSGSSSPDSLKVVRTLQARAALRGIVVVETQDDRGNPEWIASLYAMTKAFGSLDELRAWLDRVEGR